MADDDAATTSAGRREQADDDCDAVQLFARPSAQQLKRRQKQQSQQHEGSKRARADAAGFGGGGTAPPAGASAAITSPLSLSSSSQIANATTINASSFEQLGVSSWLCSVLRTVGITRPTPVQAACIPAILSGRDAVGLAQTGSGKTAAFALPALQALSREGPYGVFALVLTPTRELAFQLADQFRAFGAGMSLRDSVVVGGLDARAQAAELARRPHVVVATPGRLAELLKQDSGTLAQGFARVRFLVLDEADRLLDASFEDALRVIVAALPKSSKAASPDGGESGGGVKAVSRQTLLFSATATRALLRLQEAALPDALVFSAYDAERRRQVEQDRQDKRDDRRKQRAEDGEEEEAEEEEEEQQEEAQPATLAALDEGAVVLPANLRQEYAFVPQRVKDVYLVHVLEAWLGLGPAERMMQQQQQQQDQQQHRKGGGKGGRSSKGGTPAAAAAALSLAAAAARAGQGRGSAIVFAGTCRGCRMLELLAGELGFQAAALHARKPQRQRLASLAAFRSGSVKLLIATDVAARGLDIPSVGLVVNYDLPALPRDYVHRVGRTARAGRSGRALSLVCPADVARLKAVEALTGCELGESAQLAGPDAEQEVMKGITRVFGARRAALMALAEEDDALQETLERRRAGWKRGLSGEGGGGGGGEKRKSGSKGDSKKKKEERIKKED